MHRLAQLSSTVAFSVAWMRRIRDDAVFLFIHSGVGANVNAFYHSQDNAGRLPGASTVIGDVSSMSRQPEHFRLNQRQLVQRADVTRNTNDA
ncbi:hypothetical protein ACNKHP_26105 [Shigella boydii]